MNTITLTPAFGADYKSKAEVLHAWHNGKDFIVQPRGCYVSIRDIAQVRTEFTDIQFRYKKLTMTFIHPLGE